ncbi:MAG: hypothetical protein AAF191_04235 [Verrucomicrobiota bacterium]
MRIGIFQETIQQWSLSGRMRDLAAVMALVLACLISAEARVWTSSDGEKTFEAEFRSYDPVTGEVTVATPDGNTMQFGRDVLSEEDIAYLEVVSPAGEPSASLPIAPRDSSGPVQVYVLAGQSNMVGMGQVSGDGQRWGSEFQEAEVSVYEGPYDSEADYATLSPLMTVPLETFGGGKPTPYPGGGTQITRGFLEMEETAEYEFRPGYRDSSFNIMTVDGIEVHRREVGGLSRFTPIKLSGRRRVPFEITYLTEEADGFGWVARVGGPGTLDTVVRDEGKFPHLLDDEGNWGERNDVWYRGVLAAEADRWLGVGCGRNEHSIGPELGFGHVLGDHHEAPVLLLKVAQANRSLGWDFLPPGSQSFEEDGMTYAGYEESPPFWPTGNPSRFHEYVCWQIV